MNLKLFRSVRFNVWLFAIIALASSVGTFITQGETYEESLRRFGPHLTPILSGMGLLDVYHSWWFIALLGLMAFDVVVCKLRSLPKISPVQLKPREALPDGEHLMNSQPLKFHMVASGNPEEVDQKLAGHLTQRGYGVVRHKGSAGFLFEATRFKCQGWGDFIAHVSILMILLGAVVGAVWGFKEFIPVVPGQSRPMEHKPWVLSLDNFQISYYPGTGQASRYASDVRLYEGEKLLAQKTIIVNKPLDIHGVRFYQASWGMTGMVKSITLQVGRGWIVVPRGERVPIQGTPLSVEARMLYPDFDMDGNGQPTTKSLEPNNPAVLVAFYQGEEPMVSLWLFKNRPELCLKVGPGGEITPAAHPPFRLTDFKPVLFSGFQIAYDPGARLFWMGCATLLVGLILRFYFHRRRLLVFVRESDAGTRISTGGWSSHGPEDFKGEFQALMSSCKEIVHGSPVI